MSEPIVLQTFSKFRKRPVVVEAVRFDGKIETLPREIQARISWSLQNSIYLETLEGRLQVEKGAWIVRGIKGELYPIRHDIFLQTYAPVEESHE